MALPEGTRLYILAPIVRGRKGEYKKDLADLQKKGFQRVKVNGAFHEIDAVPALDKKFKHDIDVVIDRVVVKPDIATRLADSFETALKLADGLAIGTDADDGGNDLLQEQRQGIGPGGGGIGIGSQLVISSKRGYLSTRICTTNSGLGNSPGT